MRPRSELAIAAGVATTLLVLAWGTGAGVRGEDDPDPRASSFLAGRQGTQALADAAERLGVEVVRWRERPQGLARVGGAATTVAILAPSRPISPAERPAIVRLATTAEGADLVLAGATVGRVMRCFGYDVQSSIFDSSRVVAPRRATTVPAMSQETSGAEGDAWIHARLHVARDSAAREDRRRLPIGDADEDGACPAVTVATVDTLLLTTNGSLAMLRLTVAPHGRSVVLVSDGALVRNRTLRVASVAPLVVNEVLPRRGRLVFDEYHHGFSAGGSMAAVALDWSRRHPLGWMVWQLAVVALLALLAGGVRFGPVRAALPRARRSPLEHVRALATALSSARGHRTAIGALVRGLRRRLAATPAVTADDWRPWLAALVVRAPNTQVRASAERLVQLADAPESETAVLDAANAVEDLWLSLRP